MQPYFLLQTFIEDETREPPTLSTLSL